MKLNKYLNKFVIGTDKLGKLKNINFELAELCLQHHNKDVNEKMKIFQELDDK